MSLRAYRQYRRQGFKEAWGLAGMTEWCVRRFFALLAFGLFLVIAGTMVVTLHVSNAHAALADQGQHELSMCRNNSAHLARADRYERAMVACLNRDAIAINGVLYICEMVNTKIEVNDAS